MNSKVVCMYDNIDDLDFVSKVHWCDEMNKSPNSHLVSACGIVQGWQLCLWLNESMTRLPYILVLIVSIIINIPLLILWESSTY